jgi:hypothetical protein
MDTASLNNYFKLRNFVVQFNFLFLQWLFFRLECRPFYYYNVNGSVSALLLCTL